MMQVYMVKPHMDMVFDMKDITVVYRKDVVELRQDMIVVYMEKIIVVYMDEIIAVYMEDVIVLHMKDALASMNVHMVHVHRKDMIDNGQQKLK